VLAETLREMSIPVAKTSITTAVGFLSFAFSPIRPVQAFGVFTAVGIVFCMIWSLTVIPALLTLINPAWFARRGAEPQGGGGLHRAFSRFGTVVQWLRYPVLALTIALLYFAPRGVRQVEVQDSWVDGFATQSEFYKATNWFNEQFLGIHTLLVCVDAGQVPEATGTLTSDHLDHHFVRLPAADIEDPEALVGYTLYIQRKGYPGQPNAQRDGRPLNYTWDTRVTGIAIEGDHIVVTTTRRSGSPRIARRLKRGDTATYEIRPEWYMRPEFVERIGKLDTFIEKHRDEAVGGVLSTADYVSTTEFMIRGRKEGSRRIPPDQTRMEWVWGQYKRVRGVERWKQAVNEDYSKVLVSVYMKNANFVDTKRLMEDIREYEKAELAPLGMSIEFAGDVAVSQTLIEAIVTTQIYSLVGSLVGILIVTTIFGQSLLWGVLCVLPCALAVLCNFAVMGATGMPLGVATSMFSGMTLGIGVDYAIHLMERYRRGREQGLDLQAALADAVGATGPAVFIDAVAVALGFGVMVLSQVPANARLGGLVVVSIAGCFTATLLLLPALIRVFRLGSRIPLRPEVGTGT